MGFAKIDEKIFKLNLDSFTLAVFLALMNHGGQNSVGVFPSLDRLSEMTRQSISRVQKSIRALKSARVISWKRGGKGQSNTYFVNPSGLWMVPGTNYKSPDSYHQAPLVMVPDTIDGWCQAPTNQTYLNQTNEPAVGDSKLERERAIEAMQKLGLWGKKPLDGLPT